VKTDFINLKTKASKNGAPTEAVVYVAKEFAEWKVKVLAKLRERHSKGELPLLKSDEFNSSDEAKAQWKVVMTDLMQDASLKPFGKHLGPFAAFKRDEAAVLGESALSATALFDEMVLLQEMREYLKDKLEVEVEVRLQEDVKAKEHADAAAQAQPAKPSVFFAGIVKGAGGGAAKAKAKAGGKAEAKASSKAAAKPSGPVNKELQAFNERMSTRSYVEGGGHPSAADRNQLEKMSKDTVDAEMYPHAARWQKHILSFTRTERASW